MKILIVKLSSLGDVIQTMPVVEDILSRRADAAIDWVVEEDFAPLVRRVQGVRRVLPIADRRWRKSRFDTTTQQQRAAFLVKLKAETYDAVVDFQGLIKSALVARQALLTSKGFRATYANGSEACSYEWPVRFLLNKTIPMPKRIHAVARYRMLAGKALGYEPQGEPAYHLRHQTPETGPAPLDGRRTVVLVHGTTRLDNEWPQARWIDLGRRLVSQGFHVVLPQNGGMELAFSKTVAQAIGPGAEVWPRMALAPLLDQLALTTGVIGVDTGLSHLAVALDLPHVQIFSQPRAWRAGPVGRKHQRAVGGDMVPTVDLVWRTWLKVSEGSDSMWQSPSF